MWEEKGKCSRFRENENYKRNEYRRNYREIS